MITRRVLYFVTSILAAATLATGASANLLAPGDSGAPDSSAGPAATDTLVATYVSPYAGVNLLLPPTNLFTGTFTEEVWRTAGGTLDFYFQIANAGPDAIRRLTVLDYAVNLAGFKIDVGYVPNAALAGTPLGFAPLFVPGTSDPGASVPVEVDRSAGNGSVVGWNFPVGGLPAGSTSDVLFIHTSATQYGRGQANIIDGTTASILDLGPVPEASTVVGFGALLGLGGFGMLRLRRRSSRAASA